jgi:hypothetical protein
MDDDSVDHRKGARGQLVTARWQLLSSSGREIGVYAGSTPREAIRAMYLDLFTLTNCAADLLDDLVDSWGGRAICTGSMPCMAAVASGEWEQ